MMDPFDAMWEAARHNAWSGYVLLTLNIATAVLVAIAFNFLGDALRDAFDSRLQAR